MSIIFYVWVGTLCLKLVGSSVAHEVLTGDELTEAQSRNILLHQKFSKTLRKLLSQGLAEGAWLRI